MTTTEEYRVELPSGQIITARLDSKEAAIRICNGIHNRAFVWAMGAKMIVYRNWDSRECTNYYRPESQLGKDY